MKLHSHLLLSLCLGILFLPYATAQQIQTFSLEEAIEFAYEHSYDMKNMRKEVEIAKQKVRETTAIGLPQVNGEVSNTNYIDIPTTLLPDFITPAIHQVNEDDFGLTPINDLGEAQFFPAQFGTKYNAMAQISVSQLLFNGSYLVGLKAAREYVAQTQFQVEKSKIETKENISRAYFLVLITQKNKQILDSTKNSLEQMAMETRELFRQGFIEDTEPDQLNLLLSDLKTALLYANNQISLSYSYLKLAMGLNTRDSIVLSDKLDFLLEKTTSTILVSSIFNYQDNIDYKILENQKTLSQLNMKNEQAQYWPVVSAFFSAQTNAMRGKYNFFDSKEPWYPTTLWGLQMQIPIFSSGSRKAKVQQARLNLEKINESGNKLKQALGIEEKNAKNNFSNALLIHQNKKSNQQLAEKIYRKTQIKYKEGVSGSMDLLQAYNQYLSSKSDYINSIMELINAKLQMEKLFAKNLTRYGLEKSEIFM